MSSRQGVAILGATGSIGGSALRVLDQHPDRFRLVAATAHRSADALHALVRRYTPEMAVLAAADAPLPEHAAGTRWYKGRDALLAAATHPDAEIVLNALVGAAGLEPTLAALRAGKRVALANKESLVCGGPLVLEAARQGGGALVPVDSEHSAILQCLGGGAHHVKRLLLTASGGPFRDLPTEALDGVTPAAALRHPTWAMGAKVSIDSATLANKALEVIEAHFLFGVPYDRIDAVVHPQSIIHSMVEMVDGSVLAQMGFPTMEIPILYAFTHPARLPYDVPSFDPVAAGPLTFTPVDERRFPTFRLGVDAGRAGGTAPAVFNAANEVAVAAFLAGELDFSGIPAAVGHALQECAAVAAESIEAVRDADARARRVTASFMRDRILC